MSERRFCAMCQHFFVSQPTPAYSENTPGDDFEVICGKGHWTFHPRSIEETGFAKLMLTATECPDYLERDLQE